MHLLDFQMRKHNKSSTCIVETFMCIYFTFVVDALSTRAFHQWYKRITGYNIYQNTKTDRKQFTYYQIPISNQLEQNKQPIDYL